MSSILSKLVMFIYSDTYLKRWATFYTNFQNYAVLSSLNKIQSAQKIYLAEINLHISIIRVLSRTYAAKLNVGTRKFNFEGNSL